MKWFGDIAFSTEVEVERGLIENRLIIKQYFGDVIKNTQRDPNNQVNHNFTVNNQLSVVADPFAFGSFHEIVYVTFMGAKWRVNSVDVQYPRLILSIGDLYKEEE